MQRYGRISRVHGDEAGILPGDELVSINSRPVRDILEYQYLAAEDELTLVVRRGEETLTFHLSEDPDLEFEAELFDGLHSCRNRCVFCFLEQMPKGLRKSLYVRDDDYRLSLAHGNYITLTNVSDEELLRITSQRMSPIYVSVHTTDPELRARMLGNPKAARIMEQLRTLADARITMHAQIVLCPGINDGEQLDRTVRDLAALHPWVASVAVVPVGLTRYREGLTPLTPVDADLACGIVESCANRQKRFRRELGTRLLFPSDEFYLHAGVEPPSAGAYEGFPQLEDGIGISRLFLNEVRRARVPAGGYALVTGTLAAPLVQRLADRLSEADRVSARVEAVENNFLGETVTVAGLLAGRDIAVRHFEEDETVLIPDVALNE
ncbi:MAG: DUF512 domain-containing protein, partial [Armatimonadota bacterium]